MTWNERNRDARERFGVERATTPMLLLTWAENDENGELCKLIEPHGLDVPSLSVAMLTLTADKDIDDSQLVDDCIVRAGNSEPTVKHLLETLCSHPRHPVTLALAQAGLDVARLAQTLSDSSARQTPPSMLALAGIAVDVNASPLLRYGRDLTALAKEGCFDGYHLRPAELEAMVTVLMRMERGNPALIGASGVGKTVLVELLAREIVHGRISGIDPKTRIFSILISKLLAGTRYRGDFEQRIEDMIEAAQACKPAFVFLDEFHLAIGAGRAEGAVIDMGNILKHHLVGSDFRVIAATTNDEFNRYVAQDEAFEERFAPVRIPEPDPNLAKLMIHARSRVLAKHHGIEISELTVIRAIRLTEEHLPQKPQPKKTVTLLDGAATRARQSNRHALDDRLLFEELAAMTGRDIEQLKGTARRALRDLPEVLKARIVGQDAAIDKVVATVARQRQKLGSSDRNLGTFLFVGPTGVGKSELAKQMAVCMFGDRKKLLVLDMAEYNDAYAVSKLIGAAPGLVGSEREGAIIQWLHNHPAGGVLLFDEIEKAHGEVRNLLLGLLDNGRVRSARGNVMDCRHCVVIMTSNALTPDDLAKGAMGFGETMRETDPLELLTKDFPREFLGRLDDIMLFRSLGPVDVRQIVRLRVEEAIERLKKRRIGLVGDIERLTAHLAMQLNASKSGARGVERIVEKHLLEPIALATLRIDEEGDAEAEVNDDFYNHGQVLVRTIRNGHE